ncbi:MAG: hypothetical protein DHS80DRAFT_33318 [Piptocephalis tieghemiana]|nr:MAG: hypothetical protein DHS80DRAFT_33318 [Piptocephalis tieghemiana]
MVVNEVTSRDELDRLIQDDAVVLNRYTSNDGTTDAQLEELSTKYPSIKFVKTGVGQHPDMAEPFAIRTTPTFLIMKDDVYKKQHFGDVEPLGFTIAKVGS